MKEEFGYISPKEFAYLEYISNRAVTERIRKGKIIAFKYKSNTGRGGVTYKIPVQELSPKGLRKYFQMFTSGQSSNNKINSIIKLKRNLDQLNKIKNILNKE